MGVTDTTYDTWDDLQASEKPSKELVHGLDRSMFLLFQRYMFSFQSFVLGNVYLIPLQKRASFCAKILILHRGSFLFLVFFDTIVLNAPYQSTSWRLPRKKIYRNGYRQCFTKLAKTDKIQILTNINQLLLILHANAGTTQNDFPYSNIWQKTCFSATDSVVINLPNLFNG